MFGYVRPLKSELKVRELDDFSAVYCGLCRVLSSEYGMISSFGLNYDFTFLALLADCHEKHECEKRRCALHPTKKRRIRQTSDGLRLAAAVSVILTFHKLRDEKRDGRGFKRIAASAASFFTRRAYRRASEAMPEYAAEAEAAIERLSELEHAGETSLDRAADVFAKLLSSVFPGEDARSRELSQLLYHTGRFIYIADACDDIEEDVKEGRYNPVAARFSCSKVDGTVKDELEFTMSNSLASAAAAYELMDVSCDDGILRNIIYLGMPETMRQVLEGSFRQIKGAKI